jgi:hypothetical protein
LLGGLDEEGFFDDDKDVGDFLEDSAVDKVKCKEGVMLFITLKCSSLV